MILLSCSRASKDLPPLDETFSYQDKNPFGGFVLHQQLKELFFHNNIRRVTRDFTTTWQDITDTSALYVNVSKHLYLTNDDVGSMMSFVYNGNSLFISSDEIDSRLLDSLGCGINRADYDLRQPLFETTTVTLAPGVFSDPSPYNYFYFPFYNHFIKMDKDVSRVLGSNAKGPNYIVVFFGKGRFYLHLEPRALSNYFLLQARNYQYSNQVFSLLPAVPEHVYWDDFYHKRNFPRNESGNRSRLSVLLQYPAFEWAFWLLLLLSACYILFGGKRRQRIIDPILPNTNTTVTFTETIGRLYLQQKNNRNIADKRITYLLEHIRNHYHLNTSNLNSEFLETLSRKSNNSKAGTEALFTAIHEVQHNAETNDQQLLALNNQIEQFYKIKL